MYVPKTGVDVAKCLGYSTSSASNAAKRGQKIVGENSALQQFVTMIWNIECLLRNSIYDDRITWY